MLIRNISSAGALEVTALGDQVVEHGETIDVPTSLGERLLEQPDNWELAKKPAAPKKPADTPTTTDTEEPTE